MENLFKKWMIWGEKPTISWKHPHLCFAIQEANRPPTASPPLQPRSQLTLKPNKTSQQDGQPKKNIYLGYTSPIYTPKNPTNQQWEITWRHAAFSLCILCTYPILENWWTCSPPPIFSYRFSTGATWPLLFWVFFSPWIPQTWRVPPQSARQHPRSRSRQSPRRRTWRLDSRLPKGRKRWFRFFGNPKKTGEFGCLYHIT